MNYVKFVGGPLDGKGRNLERLPDIYQELDLPGLPARYVPSDHMPDIAIPILTYRLERIADGDYRYVFVEDHVKPNPYRKRPYADPNHPGNHSRHHTGKECCEEGCSNPAGTAWSWAFCFACNVKRMDRITASFEEIKKRFKSPGSPSAWGHE